MNWPHVHLALNHVPVLGAVIGAGLLAFGLARGRQEVVRAALGLVALVAVVGVAVYLTGEPAEEAVEDLAGVSHDAIEAHEKGAVVALISLVIVGAASVTGLWISRRSSTTPRGVAVVVLALTLLSVATLAWTANLGGRIRHPEIRLDALPGVESQSSDDESSE